MFLDPAQKERIKPSVAQPAKDLSEALFAQPALGDIEHCVLETPFGIGNAHTVQVEKDQGGEQTGTLFTVDERLILRNVKRIRRGNQKEIEVDESAAKRSRRLRRLQQEPCSGVG